MTKRTAYTVELNGKVASVYRRTEPDRIQGRKEFIAKVQLENTEVFNKLANAIDEKSAQNFKDFLMAKLNREF